MDLVETTNHKNRQTYFCEIELNGGVHLIRSVLIGLLTIGIVATGFWGYTEHQEKNAILMNAENSYQRAFHQLTYHIDQLNDEIGTVLAMNSRKQLSPSLAEVWRITSQARGDVGQLPLALIPFNKTEEFLSNIGDFSYRVAVRDLEKEPLSKEEEKTLKTLYKNSSEIKKELRKVQSLVIDNNLRWMDVESALAAEKQPLDNTIIDGFKTVEKNIEGYSEVNWGAEMDQRLEKKDNLFKNIKGENISEQKAQDIAKKFVNLHREADVTVEKTGKNADYPAYNVTIHDPDRKNEIRMDISQKGGHPIWMLNPRDVDESKMGLNKASEKAKAFLKKQGFNNMSLSESNQYDNVGVFTFVHEHDNVRVYPDAIALKIALDNGEVIGFDGLKYLSSHQERTFTKPKISKNEALKQVNKNVDIQEDHLSLIENDVGDEVLCYEFLGTMDEDTYRIFINALNGEEEKIEKLHKAEPIYQSI